MPSIVQANMVIKLGFYIQPNFILCDGRMKIFLDMPESEKFPSCRAVLWKRLEVVCQLNMGLCQEKGGRRAPTEGRPRTTAALLI